MRKLILSILLLSLGILNAQSSISFYNNSLQEALSIAKIEGKDVFLDTYAPWCKPCKKMDKVFRNPRVANFYNKNFINVKINVDLVKGKAIAEKYGIAFLPTMLIMDENGNVKQRIDGIMEADQMIEIGNRVIGNVAPVIAETSPTSKTTSLTASANSSNNEEKILKILDGGDLSSNPDYLYHESFYQIERMSGAHDSLAEKYLATQEDWSTERNMKFIVSFVSKTDSEMFNYFVSENEAFQKLIGPNKYRQTLEILINDCLYRQIPRPDAETVEELYSLLYPRKAEKYTFQYLLNRYETEENYKEYVQVGEEYLETLIQVDPMLLYKLGKYKCLSAGKKELKECVFRVEESINLSDNPDYDQYLTLAKLYLKLGKEVKALEMAEKAKQICLGNTEAHGNVTAFIDSLEKL